MQPSTVSLMPSREKRKRRRTDWQKRKVPANKPKTEEAATEITTIRTPPLKIQPTLGKKEPGISTILLR